MLERMEQFFETRLAGYDRHMLSEIEGAGEFYRFTAELLPQSPGCRVLDLGCGTGLELEEYFRLNPRARVTGIDLSGAMLQALAAKFQGKDLELIRSSYFDLDLGRDRFDAAVSVESLHHFTEERKLALYQNLRLALKPGGYFVLTDYFAPTEELERQYFAGLECLKREQGISDGALYHYDTPLTAEHESRILREAGFSRVEALQSWGATVTLRARR